MRSQHSDTRTMQARHADLNCEPKGSPRRQAQESVTIQGGGSHQKKRVGGGVKQWKYKQTNKNLPLPSALRKGSIWNSEQSQSSPSSVATPDREVTGNQSQPRLLAENHNARHQIMADMLELIQSSGHFERSLTFQSPCMFCTIGACRTLSSTCATDYQYGLEETDSARRFTCRTTPGHVY